MFRQAFMQPAPHEHLVREWAASEGEGFYPHIFCSTTAVPNEPITNTPTSGSWDVESFVEYTIKIHSEVC
jgi:hypothetical protein